ncbi:hypothetical protein ESCO_004943 [Escovopsis weberi]|uniref:Glycoside hydrolase family 17 protein n=1 Tax=Escovopsis weberi TaxID=150374 RepID=A0A0M9VRK3_ESCWE|nr:hypothetical protein ESCO_004943 [Escovopsis weberi]
MAWSKLLSLAALAAVAAPASAAHGQGMRCFPYKPAELPTNGSAPNVPLNDWWCPQSLQYGFQGFSYPLENSNCNDPSNGYGQMNADFARMKADFGASVVRMYYPLCTQPSVFKNAMRAARDNGMALILQVWTNFGGGTVWQQSQQAILDALDDPDYAAWAPYVVHWVEFGSEPVGDGMDGGGAQFVADLGKLRATLNAKGILAGISEDWDRPGIMSSSDGTGLGPVGSGVKNNSDFAHIHPMPFYHGNKPESQAWAYIKQQVDWVVANVGLPTFISETQWAWGATAHYPGHVDLGLAQYQDYWKTMDDNCEYFQAANVGWFLHAWRGEDTFDIVDPSGNGYKIPNWVPRKC